MHVDNTSREAAQLPGRRIPPRHHVPQLHAELVPARYVDRRELARVEAEARPVAAHRGRSASIRSSVSPSTGPVPPAAGCRTRWRRRLRVRAQD